MQTMKITEDQRWNGYLALLTSRGYQPYANHREHRKTYGVNGSCGYYCQDCKVKVLPCP
jgi:hypothetical protein